MAAGNRHLGYKAALNGIEATSPGTKASFYLGFLERMAPLLAGRSRAAVEGLHACARCGAPTTGDVCAFCRLVDVAVGARPGDRRHGRPAAADVDDGRTVARWGSACCSSTASVGATSSC